MLFARFSVKYLASKVVAVIHCEQCNKPRCVFSLDGKLSRKGQREIEDMIFCCGAPSSTSTLYTCKFQGCSSLIENAFYISRPRVDYVESMTQLLQKYTSVFPSYKLCKEGGKTEVCVGTKGNWSAHKWY